MFTASKRRHVLHFFKNFILIRFVIVRKGAAHAWAYTRLEILIHSSRIIKAIVIVFGVVVVVVAARGGVSKGGLI